MTAADREASPPMPSVDKALLAMLTLAEFGPTGAPLGRIANDLGLKRSSMHATLSALRYRGFVTQNGDTGFYRLGPEASRLAGAFRDNVDIPMLLRPAIKRLAEEINEVVHVAVPDGVDVLYVDKAESRRPIQAGTAIGMRLPAVTTALGRALIAQEYHDFESFAVRFKDTWTPRTPRAPRTLEQAWEPIVEARRNGVARDMEANVEGLAAVAIAILRGSTPIAAVSIVALLSETGPQGPTMHLDRLRATLDDILTPPYHLAVPE